jgi:hypothetical protein
MTSHRRHSPKNAIPQILLDEEARLKGQGLKIKETRMNRAGLNKLSQAILSLLSPYKEMADTYAAYNGLVGITCAAWNASLEDEPERGEMIKRAVNFFKGVTDAPGLLEFHQLFYELVERKLLLFPKDLRYVVNYKVTETKSTFNVHVLSLEKKE